MIEVRVTTQKEFEASVKAGNFTTCVSGQFSLVVRGSDSPWIAVQAAAELHIESWGNSTPHIESRESSSPHIVSWGNSTPHIESMGNSTPHIESMGNSTPHIVSWESSSPHIVSRGNSTIQVEASGYVRLSIRGNVIAKCTKFVSTLIWGNKARATGGTQIEIDISTPEKWCKYYDLPIKNGVAILYKAVNENFISPRGADYGPGKTPIAEDWDGGKQECGKGLHFSPSPRAAKEFNHHAKKFCGCPVAIKDIAVHPDGDYPQKVKAQKVCAPCFEVNEDGDPVAGDAESTSTKGAATT
jgi:hypothetical protein